MPYIEISQKEFEDLLTNKGYNWKIVLDSFAKETIYLIDVGGVYVRVYSSLVGGVSRGVGADAIRIVGWDTVSNLPVMSSEGRVNRTEGWKTNLLLRIDSVRDKMRTMKICKICGGILVERENRATQEKFWGCLNYKNHQKKDNNTGLKLERKGNEAGFGGAPIKVDSIITPGKEQYPFSSGQQKTEKNNAVEKEKSPDWKLPSSSQLPIVEKKIPEKIRDMSFLSKIKLQEVTGDEELLDTKLFQWGAGAYGFEKFNVIQSKVARYVDQDNNVVIQARTSTGKTIMGELFMWKVLKEGKKVIYTSPLKALTREKWDAWSQKFGKMGYRLAIVTGDYRLTDKRIRELNEAHIILCTSEMLDHRTRNMASEKSEWLMKAGLLIIDEVQLIGQKERGDKLEAGLMRFTSINPKCRLVLLSGTMPNSGQLSAWINDLNGKETILVKSEWRPIRLNMRYLSYNDKEGYYAAKDNLMKKVMEQVNIHGGDKILIFVHSKTDGRRILAMLSGKGYAVQFHNADLETDDRVNIEESFKNKEGGVRIIIATSTLAYGLNLPARIVIIAGVHRGIEEVSELDIIQMAGRSGRMGIDVEGDAIILLPEKNFETFKERIENPGDIMSQINDPFIAAFHVIGEIVGKTIKTREDVYKWYGRTLASRQNMNIDKDYIDKLVDYLLNNNAIQEVNGQFEETELGKASVYFYLRPDMIKDLMVNWTKVFEAKIENNDFIISRALSRLKMYDEVVVSKADRAYLEPYIKASKAMDTTFGGSSEGQSKIGMSYLNMIKGVKGYEMKVGEDKKPMKVMNPLIGIQRSLQQDIERVMQAMMYIDAKYSRWGKGNFWGTMGLRIKYGIGPELAGLCSLEGVGGISAKRLWDVGIRNPMELVTKRREAIMALGAKYDGIIEKNKDIFIMMGLEIKNTKDAERELKETHPVQKLVIDNNLGGSSQKGQKEISQFSKKEEIKTSKRARIDESEILKFP